MHDADEHDVAAQELQELVAHRRHPRDEAAPRVQHDGPRLKGSIGEGPNHSNFSDESSVNIVSEFRKFC